MERYELAEAADRAGISADELRGLVERGPDPHDGRAQALSLTDEGSRLLTAIREGRDRWLQALLADWPDDDITSFSTHLRHFASDLEASLSSPTRRNDR